MIEEEYVDEEYLYMVARDEGRYEEEIQREAYNKAIGDAYDAIYNANASRELLALITALYQNDTRQKPS